MAAADVTVEMLRDKNLVLFGDPFSNPLIARVLPDLPIRWTPGELTIGGNTRPAAGHAPILIHPNPLCPPTRAAAGRYVVLNSGITFREESDVSNAWQNPKLPDWALVDLAVPPSGRGPGRIVAAGFCDESWQIVVP